MATKTKEKSKALVKTPTVRVSLSTFDQSNRAVYRCLREQVKLSEFQKITHDDYRPMGMTPLLDATVEFIEHLRSHKKDDEVNVGLLLDESGSMDVVRDTIIESANSFVAGLKDVKKVDPKTAGKGFLVIATDGYENASHRYTHTDVAKLLKECEDDGWITVFLGAGIDAWAQGRQMGIHGQSAAAQTVSTVPTSDGYRSSFASVSGDSASYLSDSHGYRQARAHTASRSVTESGEETSANIGGPKGKPPTAPSVPWVQSASVAESTKEALKKVTDNLEDN